MSNPTGDALKKAEHHMVMYAPQVSSGSTISPDPRAALIQKLRALMTELEGLSLGYMRGHDVMMSMPAPQQATAARYSGKSEAYSYCARELSSLISKL